MFRPALLGATNGLINTLSWSMTGSQRETPLSPPLDQRLSLPHFAAVAFMLDPSNMPNFRGDVIAQLFACTAAMFEAGTPLMQRLLPQDTAPDQWKHYPEVDVVNGPLGARYFYHSHDPVTRDGDEHGHFHLFVSKAAMPEDAAPLFSPPAAEGERADVVHIAALSMDWRGLPLRWFTTHRWVTDEWTYPAAALLPLLEEMSFIGERGDPLINQWLTLMVKLSIDDIAALLIARDDRLAELAPDSEDRSVEILSVAAIDLDSLLA